MRIALAIVVLFSSGIAAAQSGSCAGSGLMGTVGLALSDGAGGYQEIAESDSPYVFGAAECDCPGDDLVLDILLTAAFPMATSGTAELWAGSGCDVNVAARTTAGGTVCEKLGSVDFSQFVIGSTAEHVYLPFSALALYSPVTHQCPTASVANGLYVLFFSGASSSPSGPPAASCSLEMTENVEPPGAPAGVTADSGDQSVVVTWQAPDASEPQPVFYQVLCADANDAPVRTNPPTAGYSVCGGGGLERRPLATGGAASLPAGGLASLDHDYVCSDPIPAAAAGASVVVSGLAAGQSYSFVVVGYDQYGNLAASDAVTAGTHAAPEAANGGCSAIPTTPESASITGASTAGALLVLGLLAIRRRRA